MHPTCTQPQTYLPTHPGILHHACLSGPGATPHATHHITHTSTATHRLSSDPARAAPPRTLTTSFWTSTLLCSMAAAMAPAPTPSTCAQGQTSRGAPGAWGQHLG
jgi:hypothetical protein